MYTKKVMGTHKSQMER